MRQTSDTPIGKLIRFVAVGALCFGVGIAALYILTEYARIHYLISMAVALLVVNLLGWALNRTWTFKSGAPDARNEFARYVAVNLAGFGITLVLMALLVSGFGIDYLIASLIVAALMLLANFFLHKNWSFRHRGRNQRRS